MEVTQELLDANVYKITLSGRMDIEGVGRIDIKLAGMTAAPRKAIIVDMSAVPFMSSMGIRALLMGARAVSGRGGKYVLLNPTENVRSVLESAGIDQLIPVCSDLATAISKVSS